MNTFTLSSRRGFTLVETLVAIAIVTLSVAGPFFAAQRAVIAAISARDRLTAIYLAQEGTEYIQAMRNNAILYNRIEEGQSGDAAFSVDPDFSFLNGSLASSITTCRGGTPAIGAVSCSLDITKDMGTTGSTCGSGTCALSVCSGTCPTLNISSGRYTLDSGAPTTFIRTLKFYDIGLNEEVVVQVEWKERGVTRTIKAEAYFSPWQ